MTLVVISGATRGIGRAAAIELSGQGLEVAVVGRERERVDGVAGRRERPVAVPRSTAMSPT